MLMMLRCFSSVPRYIYMTIQQQIQQAHMFMTSTSIEETKQIMQAALFCLWDTSWAPLMASTLVQLLRGGFGIRMDTVQQIQQAHRFVNTSDASNSVAKSSHASLIIGDFNSKVGCVIAVCVSYIFTTFYLMSICLTPLDVPPVRMHPC